MRLQQYVNQMFKLDLEKAEEPEIKWPTFVGSLKKQESYKKHLLLLYWLCQSLWLCASQQTGKFFKRWSSRSDHLTCPLRNLYAGPEATVKTRNGTMDWFQIGKGVFHGCILSPWLFNLIQSTSWEMLGWMKHKLESRFLGEISVTSNVQVTPPSL